MSGFLLSALYLNYVELQVSGKWVNSHEHRNYAIGVNERSQHRCSFKWGGYVDLSLVFLCTMTDTVYNMRIIIMIHRAEQ